MQKMSANLALTVNVLLKAKVKVDQKRLEPAPCFEGQVWYDGMIQNVKLSDYKDKWVVFFFIHLISLLFAQRKFVYYPMPRTILQKLIAKLLELHVIQFLFIENLL